MSDNDNFLRIPVSAVSESIHRCFDDEAPPHNELSSFGNPLVRDPHEFDFLATTLAALRRCYITCQISERKQFATNYTAFEFVNLSLLHALTRYVRLCHLPRVMDTTIMFHLNEVGAAYDEGPINVRRLQQLYLIFSWAKIINCTRKQFIGGMAS